MIGMFLYAKLVMWNLHEQPTSKDFQREMRPDTLPNGLEQAYVVLCIVVLRLMFG